MLNATALTSPVPAALRPRTVSVAICANLPSSTPLVFNSTQPVVNVNSAELKLASPLSACVIPAAAALVLAVTIDNLLCSMAAALLILALSIISGLI